MNESKTVLTDLETLAVMEFSLNHFRIGVLEGLTEHAARSLAIDRGVTLIAKALGRTRESFTPNEVTGFGSLLDLHIKAFLAQKALFHQQPSDENPLPVP